MAADLADRVDDVLSHLLRDRLELFVAEPVKVGGLVNGLKEAAHQWVLVAMKSVICSSSAAPLGAASTSAERARW